MRISDWSSDVCSSDLASLGHAAQHGLGEAIQAIQVGVDDVMPLIILHAQHQVIAGNTGIVDQDCRLSEMLLNELKSAADRSEEHTSELQSLIRQAFAVYCFNKKV